MTKIRTFAAGLMLASLAACSTPEDTVESRELELAGNRFRPLTWEALDAEQRAMVESILAGPRDALGGPFNVLLRSPAMGDLAQKLGAYARFDSSLPATLRELAIIMTARYWTAEYEWYAHKNAALAAGLDPAIVDAIAAGQRPSGMQDDEAAVYDFVGELLYEHRVSDASFAAAIDALGERGVVDVIGTVGYYGLVSLLLNADEYPLPDGVEPELALALEAPREGGPWVLDTEAEDTRIRVSVVTRGLTHPWGLAFLPNGDMLVSERRGTLRIVRGGELDPEPIAGIPEVAEASSGGLMDIALHPDFESNRWVYFVYAKPGPIPAGAEYNATTALARGRFDGGNALTDVEDVFVANAWSTAPGGHGSRILFAPDGTLFMTQPHRRELERAQNTLDHVGTLLRINDDGSVPADNPFVGREGFLPEIYSYGHRVGEGLAFHPETGELWASEHGPQGGDEVNVIVAGGNYGWPLVTYGRDYDGTRVSDAPWREDLLEPELFWVPSIAPSGTMFYTGERFPAWRGDLFIGALSGGAHGGHIQRITFNENGETGREALLEELGQRVREVKQGPDGLLYVLTEEENGALLVIAPDPG